MEYQPLPPVSTMQQLTNGGGGGGNNHQNGVMNGNGLQLNTMQPPLLPLSMPLQVVHNLQQLNNNNNNINTPNNNTILNNTNNTQNTNSQNLPPPQQQLLQAIHQQGGNGPNSNPPNNTPNGGATDDQGNRWTQYQVQQLWRQHHAYLNGKVEVGIFFRKNAERWRWKKENLH
ncbi:AAC-rich mRNA clone AAC11 protein-like [Culicoides brevitarsis]|uniref:AAC-rich mRNA clone AAC11 protein-like n=1 Tax=Culicoides brevitarsis TaxID=469753 RepID=UPI00307C9DF2